MSKPQPEDKEVTIIQLTRVERALVLIIPPIAGFILGYLIPAIADWAASLPWFPFQGPLELVASIPEKWAVIVMSIAGLIAGAWLTAEAMKDSLVIKLADDEVALNIKGADQIFPRSDIAVVFIEGKQLVLMGDKGRELAREPYESKPARIEQAFVKHGYPWSSEGDPHEDHYRLWVKNTPDLPPALNALMTAREEALQKKDKDSAKEIRREVGKLGVSVKDKGRYQYWRSADKVVSGEDRNDG